MSETIEEIAESLAGQWTSVSYLSAILTVLIEISKELRINQDDLIEKINQAAHNP